MPFKDPEKRRAYAREWIRRNAEKVREAMRRWRERHPQEHLDENHRYYARNRERIDQRNLEYQRRRPEVRSAIRARRRARAAGAEGSFTTQEWLDLVDRHGGRCAYCGGPGPLEGDHRVPLARGGTNYVDNILPACVPCNRRKHTRTEVEFRVWLAEHPHQGPQMSEDFSPYTFDLPKAG